MDIHGKMSWTLGPNLRRKTVSCPCIRFLCFPPSPPPPPCALLPYLRACHAPVFIVGIILFDCLRIFFDCIFDMFTSVYICLLSVWGCCDWYIHLHGGFENGRLDLMNVRVFLEGATFMHFNAHYFN